MLLTEKVEQIGKCITIFNGIFSEMSAAGILANATAVAMGAAGDCNLNFYSGDPNTGHLNKGTNGIMDN